MWVEYWPMYEFFENSKYGLHWILSRGFIQILNVFNPDFGRSLSQARCFIWQSRNGLPLKNILNSFLWKSPQDLSIVLWPTDIWLTASVDLFSKIFRSRDFTFAFIFHFIPCNFAETFANLFLWNVLVNFFSPSRFFTFDSSSFTWLTFLSRARCAHSRFRCRRLFRLSNCFGVN